MSSVTYHKQEKLFRVSINLIVVLIRLGLGKTGSHSFDVVSFARRWSRK